MDYILALDGEILLWIQMYLRHEVLTPVLTFITHLGDKGLFWIVLSLLLLIKKSTRKTGFLSLLSLLIIFLIVNVCMKNGFARIRPYETLTDLLLLIEKQSDFSFPSGHSASSFASAVVLFKQLPKRYGIPILILAVLIAFSRIYMGVHYPTDILAGILIGSIVALLIVYVNKRIEKKKIMTNNGKKVLENKFKK